MPADPILVTYRVHCPAADLAARLDALLLEQTVELPRAALQDAFVLAEIVGRVVSQEQVAEGDFRVVLAQPAATGGDDPAQLLNVLFGNSSLQPDVVLEDIHLPDAWLERLGGPRFGIAGLRETCDAHERPLTSTALKPMGLAAGAIAELCRTFALAGIDLIKDDHGLADHPFCRFEERVTACLAATRAAADSTGRASVYAPNLVGPPEVLLRQLRFAQDAGCRAVMLSPMLVGLPAFHELVSRHARVPVLAHPAFGGSLRIEPVALLGTLFRSFGADAVIFPNFGGRFAYSAAACRALADRLRLPLGPLKPSLPVPAGGIKFNRVGETLEFYGADAMLLIGGSLYEAQDALLDRARQFVAHAQSFRIDAGD